MASRTLPNIGLKGFWGTGFDGWAAENDLNLLKLSVLTQGRALALVSGRPSSPSNGQVYIINEGGGADANKIIIRDNGAWIDLTPLAGWKLFNVAISAYMVFDGTVWAPALDALPDPTGLGGYVLGVNAAGTAYELVQLPGGITTVENAALRYRFKVTTAGTSGAAGWGEIQTYKRDYSRVHPTTITASSTLAGYDAADLDNETYGGPGEGWYANTGAEVGAWVEYEYAEPVGLLAAVFFVPEDWTDTPQGVDIEYYDESTSSWELLEHEDFVWSVSTTNISVSPLPLVPTDATTGGEYLTDAPSDGTTYGRKDGGWEPVGGGGDVTEARILGRDHGAGDGPQEELTISEVLDLVLPGAMAQGAILYRGASGWSRLPIGAAGRVLTAHGTGTGPSWDVPSASGGGGSGSWAFQPPSASAFTHFKRSDFPAIILTDDTDVGMTFDSGGENFAKLAGVPVSGSWTMTLGLVAATGNNYPAVGLGLYESATGKYDGMVKRLTSGTMYRCTYASNNTATATYTLAYNVGYDGTQWYRIESSGSNYIMSWSPNGKIWKVLGTVAKNSFLTTAADYAGLYTANINSFNAIGHVFYYSLV